VYKQTICNFVTPVIKYKCLCSHNLSMTTKGDLTRDEAKEAIKILALINGNLESIMLSIFAILILFISSDYGIFFKCEI